MIEPYGSALLGGVLIGLAAVWLLASLGRIAGISGIAGRVVNRMRGLGEQAWPVFFVVGLGIGGWLAYGLQGSLPPLEVRADAAFAQWPALLAGGLIVGIGTRMGSGCTSGHGVCGISRFSIRSLVATLMFLGVGMATATVLYS